MGRPVAVITGASMGIGAAFAEALAARGYDLALVARSADKLEALAQRLHGFDVATVVADLEHSDAIEAIAAQVEQRFGRVDLLVNNAGFGLSGRFGELDRARQLAMVRLNVEALVALTHRFLPGLLERRGGVINVASTASFSPVPFMAVYGATKAFVISFTEALAEEYRDAGLRVVTIAPGATRTNFFAVSGAGPMGPQRSPADVARTALRAFDRGSATVVDGWANVLLSVAPRFAPRPLVARVTRKLMRR